LFVDIESILIIVTLIRCAIDDDTNYYALVSAIARALFYARMRYDDMLLLRASRRV